MNIFNFKGKMIFWKIQNLKKVIMCIQKRKLYFSHAKKYLRYFKNANEKFRERPLITKGLFWEEEFP